MTKPPLKDNVEPLILAMDFLRNPIFLPTNTVPDDYDGRFLVNGLIKATVLGPPLLAPECDLFHALTHFAKKQNFDKEEVYFIMCDLLEQMGWPRDGYSYKRLKKAFRKLQQSIVEFESVLEDGWQSWNILTGSSVNAKKSERGLSWARLSPEMLKLFRDGSLKAVHPDYFRLETPIEKRMFGLLSVRASDLECWKIEILELRDLIPLRGKSYENVWKVWQTLSRCFEGLRKKGMIHDFSKEKVGKSKTQISILPNPEFFFSGKRQRALASPHFVSKDKEESRLIEDVDVNSLVKRGVSQADAIEIIFNTPDGRTRARKQIEHLDYLIAQGKSPKINQAGWLRAAIIKDYRPPESLQTSKSELNLSKAWFLLEEAKRLARTPERKALEKAIEKAREASFLGREISANEIIQSAEKALSALP